MNILAIGCHPDDLEIGCYGTLAKYVQMGHKVSVCHVANGNLGHVEIMQDELRKIRFEEAQAAAEVIGATHYSVDANDLYVTAEDDGLITRLAKVVRQAQPDLIITHYESDYMNDHVQTYQSAMRASFAASLPHFDLTAQEPVAGTCPIYHMDTLSGLGFIPTEYVDISDTIELKLKALACHHSQIDWMREHDHIDFLDFVRSCAKIRGYQSGVAYAEGFRANINYLRMTTKRLLP
ncbi:MAG: PIG-L family deacetylase [Clostridia bacterium]|nr:PIG-L family deacetylase [Clostridia bacterium]